MHTSKVKTFCFSNWCSRQSAQKGKKHKAIPPTIFYPYDANKIVQKNIKCEVYVRFYIQNNVRTQKQK